MVYLRDCVNVNEACPVMTDVALVPFLAVRSAHEHAPMRVLPPFVWVFLYSILHVHAYLTELPRLHTAACQGLCLHICTIELCICGNMNHATRITWVYCILLLWR